MSGTLPNTASQPNLFFTTRHGGLSTAPYNSLNLSYGVGDISRTVSQNRERLKKDHSLSVILSARQIHGDKIFIAGQPLQKDLEVDGYDALMTDIRGIALLIQQADCQGIALHDPVNSAIACIHSGWMGSVKNIIAKTVAAMKKQYHTDPADLHASISPSLGPCCAEFTNHSLELPPSFLAFQVKENYFDFWQISRMQLLASGICEKNIDISGLCSSCSQDHFSYRRACREGDGRTGRCATVIALY